VRLDWKEFYTRFDELGLGAVDLHSMLHEKLARWLDVDPDLILKSCVKIGIHSLVVALLWFVGGLLIFQLKKRWENKKEDSPVRAIERKKRADTLTGLTRAGFHIFLLLFFSIGILAELGIDLKAILASAGIVGVAIGFGAQSLVKDVIAGFFILLENQVRVGDAAIINGVKGLVEGLSFRTLILRDIEGTVHVFPNGSINTLANRTRDWSAYVMDIGIAYKEDIDQAITIMKDLGTVLQRDPRFSSSVLEEIEVFGVDSLGDSAVIIKARIKTMPLKQWEVGREYLRLLKYRFDKEGIEIPFPHRSIYFGEASKPVQISKT